MNKDERIHNQLGTVMSAAVRLGMTSSGMSREALAAEVRDLVELALHVTAHVPGELSAEGEKHLAWQKEEGKRQELFWRNVNAADVSLETDRLIEGLKVRGIREVQPEPVPPNAMPDARCDVRVPAYGAGMEHDHLCNKVTGHADGPAGSDHQCDACGQLFTAHVSDEDPSTGDDVEIEL